MANNGHGARDALVEALAGRFAHHARQVRIDVAEQIRAAFRSAGFTGPYLDASHIVGTLPPGVGGLPPPAELVDDAAVVLTDDDGVVLAVEDGAAAADHTHPASGGPPSGAAGGDLAGSYPNPQIAAGVITDADVAAANKDGTAAVPSLRTIGTTATSAAAGNHAHAGMITNPMTTLGDLIAGGASGAPGRLGVGAGDQVLGVVAGAPAWVAAPALANLLVNPAFAVWARGAGPFSAASAYAADRWQLNQGAGATISASRDTANADAGSLYCLAATYTHGGSASGIQQVLEDFAGLRGRTVTLAVRVKTATANAVRLSVVDSVGSAFSAFHTGGGAYETLAVTFAVAAGATLCQARVVLSASCTAYLDAAVLVVGSSAPAFVPLHPADDLARCQRYYWEVGGTLTGEPVMVLQATAATAAFGVLTFPAEMAIPPTLTVSAPGDWSVFSANGTSIACTAVSAPVGATRKQCRIDATVASGLVAGNASMMKANATLAARLKFEANP